MQAFEQWYRAQVLIAYFGAHLPKFQQLPDNKMRYVDRRDCAGELYFNVVLPGQQSHPILILHCAAAVQYHVDNVQRSCRFECPPCEGATFRAECGLLFEGYCADCEGCPVDFYRYLCGGPRVAWDIEYDYSKVHTWDDVMDLTRNATWAEVRKVPA